MSDDDDLKLADISCIEQLRDRLNLNVTEKIIELSEEEVIAEVDTAVGQLLNPLKMKCHLVNQLNGIRNADGDVHARTGASAFTNLYLVQGGGR